MKGVTILATLLLVAAMVFDFMPEPSEAAVDCGQVSSALVPCIPYLTGGGGGNPAGACCSGVKNLNNMAQTKPDRQTVCNCLKAAAARFPNINPDAASGLPKSCGVNLNIPISRNTNCNNIS